MDSWYQWVQKEFKNTEIPKKRKNLTKEEKDLLWDGT